MEDVFDREKIRRGSEVKANDFSLYRARYGDEGRIYIRDATGYLEDVVGRYIASKTVLDGLDVRTPAVEYDEENGRILIEDVGEKARPVIHTGLEERENDFDVEEYIDAVLGKYVVGDQDVTGNILVDEEGDLHAVDFVGAGERVLEDFDGVYDHVLERMGKNLQRAGEDVSLDRADIRECAVRLAERLDVEDICEELYSHERLEGFRDMEVFVSNLEWLEKKAE